MKVLMCLSLAVALTLGWGAVAFADEPGDTGQRVGVNRHGNHRATPAARHEPQRYQVDQNRVEHNRGVPVSVPELDPGALGGAIVLLLGGLALVVDRRRGEHPVEEISA